MCSEFVLRTSVTECIEGVHKEHHSRKVPARGPLVTCVVLRVCASRRRWPCPCIYTAVPMSDIVAIGSTRCTRVSRCNVSCALPNCVFRLLHMCGFISGFCTIIKVLVTTSPHHSTLSSPLLLPLSSALLIPPALPLLTPLRTPLRNRLNSQL